MTCAKTIVRCFIVTDNQDIFVGENFCDTPQQTCPRAPGEGYEKCKTICNQQGHAEEMAIKAAEENGASLVGATAYIHGIGHYCKDCQIKLFAAGVKSLRLIT